MQFKETIEHKTEDLREFTNIFQQTNYRLNKIEQLLECKGVDIHNLSAIVTRAGVLPPIEAGAYEINSAMIDYNMNYNAIEHASNLRSEERRVGKECRSRRWAYQ